MIDYLSTEVKTPSPPFTFSESKVSYEATMEMTQDIGLNSRAMASSPMAHLIFYPH